MQAKQAMQAAQGAHDPKVVSVFEIISAYFVDTVFNHIYASARTGTAAGASLSDEYARRLQAYVTGVKTDSKCYNDVIHGVHKYFTTVSALKMIGYADFVNTFVRVCVPVEYYEKFSTADKDDVLSNIICDLIANLAALASTPEQLRNIITDRARQSAKTISFLKESSVDFLLSARMGIYNKFIRKTGEVKDTIPVGMLDTLKGAIRKLMKEKTEYQEKLARAETALEKAAESLGESKKRAAKLERLVELLRKGQALGPAAAGASLLIPKREVIAEENRAVFRKIPSPPAEVTIADLQGPSRAAPARAAAPVISSGFFRPTAALAPKTAALAPKTSALSIAPKATGSSFMSAIVPAAEAAATTAASSDADSSDDGASSDDAAEAASDEAATEVKKPSFNFSSGVGKTDRYANLFDYE